jgi:Ca2+-binding EF-hand superfamily protein
MHLNDLSESDDLLLDFPQKPRMLTEHRRQASRHLALRRAVNVAAASTCSKIKQSDAASTVTSFVMHARAKIELDASLLEAEMNFQDRLREMDHEDRIDTLFELFDKDGNQLVSITETKDFILNRMKEMKATKESIPAVNDLISRYERLDDYFDRETFGSLMMEMQHAFECSNFLDFCLLMAQKVAFNEDARRIIEDSLQGNLRKSFQESCTKSDVLAQFADVVVEARMILLFSMLDSEGNGIVCLSEVVKHLFRLSMGMDSVKRQILLTYDKGDLRTLNHQEFSEFMLNVLAIVPEGISFHDLADAVTLSVTRDDVSEEDLEELMMDPDELIAKAAVPLEHPTSDLIFAYGRLRRLFSMLDTNHDTTVNVSEFVPFLGRYNPGANQQGRNAVFLQYDSNRDGRLDFEEFANMIIKFAGNDVDPHKLIDFLCVQVALGDNAQNKSAYTSSLHSLRSVGSLLQGGLTNKQKKRISYMNLEKRGQEKKREMQSRDIHPVVSMFMRQSNAFLKFGHKESTSIRPEAV